MGSTNLGSILNFASCVLHRSDARGSETAVWGRDSRAFFFLFFFAHLSYYYRAFAFSFSLPRHNSDPGSLSKSPPPPLHCGTPLHFCPMFGGNTSQFRSTMVSFFSGLPLTSSPVAQLEMCLLHQVYHFSCNGRAFIS